MAMLHVRPDRNRGLCSWNSRSYHAAVRSNPVHSGLAGFVLVASAIVLAAICGVLAIAASRGVERQRAVWTLALAAFFCFYIAILIVASSSSSYTTAIVVNSALSLVLLAAPVALTYAALSRRLIDVGFFLNRAAVFAIVSTIVIGAFVLVDGVRARGS
jgi:hypothetical protein